MSTPKQWTAGEIKLTMKGSDIAASAILSFSPADDKEFEAVIAQLGGLGTFSTISPTEKGDLHRPKSDAEPAVFVNIPDSMKQTPPSDPLRQALRERQQAEREAQA